MSNPTFLFWASVLLLGYTFLAYPSLMLAWASLRSRPRRTRDAEPTVSVLIVAHNESARIAGRLENLLTLDYSRDRLEIVLGAGPEFRISRCTRRLGDFGGRVARLPRAATGLAACVFFDSSAVRAGSIFCAIAPAILLARRGRAEPWGSIGRHLVAKHSAGRHLRLRPGCAGAGSGRGVSVDGPT